jgi:3-hydroxyisobutyrate dehydrogenase
VFGAIGDRTVWLGSEPGAASRIKLVVNSWVLAVTNAAGEAISLARGLDVDPQLFLDAIDGGPLDLPYLRTKVAAMLTGDYTPSFTATMAAKDAGLILAAAEEAGLQLDVAGAVAQRLSRTAQLGHGDDDMAANYHASFMGPI